MRHLTHQRARFWFEAGLVAASLALWLATLLWPTWIELVFGIDPDQGDGSLERALTILFPLIAIGSALIAGHEWRRRAAGSSSDTKI
jgi:hypothetical protein